MRDRQQIQSALLLLLSVGLGCAVLVVIVSLAYTLRLPGNSPPEMEPLPPTPIVIQPTPIPALSNVITDAATLATPGVAPSPTPILAYAEPAPTPNFIAIDPPVPAALAELSNASLVKSVEFAANIPVEKTNELQSQFYPANNIIPAQYGVDRYKIHFRSRNELGHWVSIRAEIFVPHVDTPTEFPVFVYGAGTTGINNECAPLDEDARGRNWGQYQIHLASYAAQGFITVMPHWQGYDDQTRTHNYFIASLEASTLLDVTRATYELFNNNLLPDVAARPAAAIFFGGYSQGGHGAFAALDAAPEYAPELPIKGVVGHATSPNVEALLRERPPLAPYIVYSYLNYYGDSVIKPEAVFLPHWQSTFYEDASTKCVDEAYQYYPRSPELIYLPEFSDALYGNRLAEAFPAFKQALDLNYVGGSSNTEVPVVLFHGEADTIVSSDTHEQFVARLCNLGKTVDYKLYPGVTHFQTRQASFVDSINWMRNILSGQPPQSQCSEFFTSKID
jgi:predicted esterase